MRFGQPANRLAARGGFMLIMFLIMLFPIAGIALFFFLPWDIALPIYLGGLVMAVIMYWGMMRTMKTPPRTGIEGMIGETALIIDWDHGSGTVRCHGEIWEADSADGRDLSDQRELEVVEVRHLRLIVQPQAGHHGPPADRAGPAGSGR